MFADAGPLGADVDGNEVEFPESAKVAAPRDGNVKGCAIWMRPVLPGPDTW